MAGIGRSFGKRIFFSIVLFVIFPLGLSIGLIVANAYSRIAQQQIQLYQENAQYLSRLCDEVFKNIKELSLLIYNDEKAMGILNKGTDISETDQALLNSKASVIFFSNDDIESLTLYVEKLNLIIYRKRNESNRFYRVSDEKEAESYFIRPDLAEEMQYQISTSENPNTGKRQIVLDQSIMDLDYEPLMRMEVVYQDSIFAPLFSLPEQAEAVGDFVLDEDGKFLYESLGGIRDSEVKEEIQGSPQGVSYSEDGNYVIIRQPLEDFPFSIALCIPLRDMMQEFEFYGGSLLLVFLVVLAAIGVVAVFLTGMIKNSIGKFTKSIAEFRQRDGDGTAVFQPEIQEMDELAAEFFGMMKELNQLIEEKSEARYREKRAYLKLLRVQINPHFLYNALQTLQFMALKRKAFEINGMLASLGKILRYSLDWDTKQVTLDEELENTLEYLNIQKFRYVEELKLSVERPGRTMEICVPKMFLQPLVENCFVHGFKGKTEDYQLRLIVKEDEDQRVSICICDNGNGMGEEEIAKLNRELAGGERYEAEGHTGILSAAYRLRECCPDSRVWVEQGEWFVVRISLGRRSYSIVGNDR